MDTDPIQEVHAVAENVTDTNLGTTISENETSIMTVEHLLSALAGLGIDNVYIDLHGPEIPIMDGSAASFILLIESAGIQEQSAAKKFLRIKKNIRVEEDGKFAEFRPKLCKFSILFNPYILFDSKEFFCSRLFLDTR